MPSLASDHFRVNDPLFEGLRVALAQRGERYSPAYIQGLSGMAFRLAGPCPCAPTCSAPMTTSELAERLGYGVEVVCPADADRQPEPVVERVRRTIDAGHAALVFHAFSTAEWDVVTGYDATSQQFLGHGSGTGQDLAKAPWRRFATCGDICPVGGALVLGERTTQPDLRALELAALAEAVRHAHTGRDRFLELADTEPLPWRFRQGLACLDAWRRSFVAQPERVPELGDRYALSVYCRRLACAAPFLREIAARHGAAGPALNQAGDYLGRTATALTTVYDQLFEGWSGWRQPDRARAERAADLLAQARSSYAAGIGSLLGALNQVDPALAAEATRPVRIERGAGTVRLLGLPTLGQGQHGWLGALAAALAATAHPSSYSDLMGLSGLAFDLRPNPDDEAVAAALADATGWRLTRAGAGSAAHAEFVADLDAGLPAVGHRAAGGAALLVGYADGGRTLLWQTDDQPQPQPLSSAGLSPRRLTSYTAPLPLHSALRQAVARAVDQYARRRDGVRARFAAWQADLGDDQSADGASAERDADLTVAALLDARRAAVSFLGDWLRLADGPAGEALVAARDAYELVVARLGMPAHTRDQRRQRVAHVAELDATAVRHLAAALAHWRDPARPARVGRGIS